MTDATHLKTRPDAATINPTVKRRGKPARTLTIVLEPMPRSDVRAADARFQSAFDALLVKAIERGLACGTLRREPDGMIVSTRGTR